MKGYFVILFTFFLSFNYAQNNLVENPGFEDVEQGFNCKPLPGDEWFALRAYWYNCSPWTIPDLNLNLGCAFFRVGSPDLYCSGGHISDHYVRCDYHEYIIHSISKIEPGKMYYVEFYVKWGPSSGPNAGLKFFKDRPQQCGDESRPLEIEKHDDDVADIIIPSGTNISNWTKVSSIFKADKEYKWFALGEFRADHRVGDSYEFDDISIIEIGSSECPDVNYIQNSSLDNIGKITFASQNLTIAGNNVASTIAQGNVVIGAHAIVEYKSAKRVVLEDGFSTDDSTNFEAHIAPCAAGCFSPLANAGKDSVMCGFQTIQLGVSPEENVSYTWNANPISALAFLSNPHSSNPTFSLPAAGGGNGRVIYTLTATNTCGDKVSDDVVITYDAQPNNNPTVSVTNINYSDNIEFDVNFGTHTQEIIVEIYSSGGALLNSFNYYLGTDFTCCSYHWKIPLSLSPCSDYQIKVYTRNICSTVLSSSAIINWVRNRSLSFTQVSNVITPAQPTWCFYFTGAVQYQLTIINQGGIPEYVGSGFISPPKACVWSGECNQLGCSSSVNDGTHYYELKIIGCDGNTTTTTTGFIQTLLNKHKTSDLDTLNTMLNNKTKMEVEVYPNPTTGVFTITLLKTSKQINKPFFYHVSIYLYLLRMFQLLKLQNGLSG
jgi:hypothetical protein